MTEMRKSLFLCECLDDDSHLPLFQHTGAVMTMTVVEHMVCDFKEYIRYS